MMLLLLAVVGQISSCVVAANAPVSEVDNIDTGNVQRALRGGNVGGGGSDDGMTSMDNVGIEDGDDIDGDERKLQMTSIQCTQAGTTGVRVMMAGAYTENSVSFQIKDKCSGQVYMDGTIKNGYFFNEMCIPSNLRYQFVYTKPGRAQTDVFFHNSKIVDIQHGHVFDTPTGAVACPYADATLLAGTTHCLIQHTVPPVDSNLFLWETPSKHYYGRVWGGRNDQERCPVVGSYFDGSNCYFPNNLGIPYDGTGPQPVQVNNRFGYKSCLA